MPEPIDGLSYPRGEVWITDFDDAVARKLGGSLMEVSEGSPQGGEAEEVEYWVTTVDGLDGKGPALFDGKIPIFFGDGNLVHTVKRLPCIVIVPQDPDAALDARRNGYQIDGRWPTPAARKQGTRTVTIGATGAYPDGRSKTGFREHVSKMQPEPFDLMYDIYPIAPRMSWIMQRRGLLRHCMKAFPPLGCKVTVVDSLGDERSYTTSTLSQTKTVELVRTVDNRFGYRLSIKVRGELELADTRSTPSLHSGRVTANVSARE